MSKKRNIIILSILLLFLLLAWNGIRNLKINESAKSLLLTTLQKSLSGNFDINNLKINYSNVLLTRVVILPENKNFELNIDKIQIGYSLKSFIKNGLNFKSLPNEITIVNPHITIKKTSPKKEKDTKIKKDRLISTIFIEFDKFRKELSFINKINIYDGEASLEQLKIVSDLQGWIEKTDKNNLEFKFDGCMFSENKKNFRFTGEKISDKFISKLKLKEYYLNKNNPILYNKYFQFSNGMVNADLYFEIDSTAKNIDEIIINGDFVLQNGEINLFKEKIKLDDISLNGNFQNKDFIINELKCNYDNKKIESYGKLSNIFNLELDMKIAGREINVDKLCKDILPEFAEKYNGRILFNIGMKGNIRKPKLAGRLQVTDFSINGYNIGNIKTKVDYDKKDLKIIDFVFSNNISSTDIVGDINWQDEKKLNVFINSKLFFTDLSEKIPIFNSKHKEGILEAGLSGNFDDIQGVFKFNYDGVDSNDVRGIIDIKNNILSCNGRSLSKKLSFNGSLDLKNNEWSIESLKNPFGVINEIMSIPFFEDIDKNIDIEFKAEKSEDSYSFRGRGYGKTEKSEEKRIAIDLNGYSKKEDKKRYIFSQILYYPEPEKQFIFSLDAVSDKNKLVINKLDIPGFFNAIGDIDLLNKNINTQIALKTNISELEKFFNKNIFTLKNGNIDGLIKLNGSLSKPDVFGEIKIEKTEIGGISGLNGFISFEGENLEKIKINKLNLNDEYRNLITGWGNIDLKEDNIYLTIKGDSLNCESILNAINYDTKYISGFSNANLELIGRVRHPRVLGSVHIENGDIYGHEFSNLNISLGNPKKISGNGKSRNETSLAIRKFSLERENNLAITGEGYLPLNKNGELDILIEGKGDILSLLPEFENFFIEGSGKGSFNIRLAGNFDNLTAGSGNIKISEGNLKFSSVFKELKDIQVDATLKPGERFIKIDNISAIADDRYLKISNVQTAKIKTDDGKEIDLVPMVLLEDGLNWGILIIEDDNKGVRLNIPLLMEKEEIGEIHLSGKNPEEKFYFAGPTDNPLLRGRIDVKKMMFTYPFLGESDEESKKGVVERFLERIYWDLSIFALGDVRYFRVEPTRLSTFTDNIYFNISADDMEEEGIEFNGTIRDETFGVDGKAVSTRGTIEFMDLNFRVERFEVVFNKESEFPTISGRARTTIRDSSDFPRDIYVIPYYKSSDSNDGLPANSFDNLSLKFELNVPSRDRPSMEVSQEEILKMLGYSVDDIKTKAPTVFGMRAQKRLLRPIVRPIERKIKNILGLDELTLKPSFAKNLTEYIFESSFNLGASKRLGEKVFVKPSLLFQSSSLVLGKYIAGDFYFSYEGQLVTGFVRDEREKLGLSHLFGLEYRIAPGVMFEMQYDYQFDRYQNKEDKRLWLRQYFTLSDKF